jgi:hypothetical protein
MSKLNDAILAKPGARTVVASIVPIEVDHKLIKESSYSYNQTYRVSATIGVTMQVYEHIGLTHEVMRDCRRAIAEEVFGEFRTPLLQINVALMEGDKDKAMGLVEQILEGMFRV